MSKIPMFNLTEPHFQPSSLHPGVSGESVNAPYGPKAIDECGIDSVKTEYNSQANNRPLHGVNDFAKTFVTGLEAPVKDESSLRPIDTDGLEKRSAE